LLQSPEINCQQESADVAAVSARNILGPNVAPLQKGSFLNNDNSSLSKPPSGPINIADFIVGFSF
jgi:hypothetical protein